MTFSHFSRSALGLCSALLLLGGCGGSQPATPMMPAAAENTAGATHGIPQWEATHAAHRACAHARQGKAQCLVLVLDKVQPAVAGLGPADFQARYKLPSATKGSGQVVAIVDAYDNPNVIADLAAYRSQFGLGTAPFNKYNQQGQQSNYPSGNTSWGVEIDLDVQMASASCPLCTIDLIEANSSSFSDLDAAEVEAVKLGAHIVSNSWVCYGSITCVHKAHFSAPGVTYLASSGDDGSGQIGAPAALASVAAIGGTVLTKTGSQYSESVWDSSGGGCATGVPKPRWQHDTVCAYRAVADASAVAWDVAEYDTYGQGGWFTVGGTSVSAPLLAGVFGLAGNATNQDGGRTFWKSAHHRDLYDVCSPCLFSTYSYAGGWGSPDGIGAF